MLGSYITRREFDVLSLYATGRRPAEIAKELRMNEKTVNGHTQHMRDRLGLRTIHQLIAVVWPELSPPTETATRKV